MTSSIIKYMNKFIYSTILVGVLSVGSLAWAESGKNAVPIPTHIPASPDLRAKIKEQKSNLKREIKETKAATRSEIKNKKEETEKDIRELKEEMRKKTQEFKETVRTKKAEIDDKVKAKRDELEIKLRNIKDTVKKDKVERIDKQIDDLNARMMSHFSEVLDKMSAVLVKIGERADKASEKGYDVSSVRTAINNANKAIETARSAVIAQSGKTYAIQVTTENGLKGVVGRARDALHKDLNIVKDLVKTANEAVHKAAVTLGQLKDQKPVPSPSVSISPTVVPSETPAPTETPNQ